MGTLKLYQLNNHVHMSSLKHYFKDLFPNTTHKTTYKFVEPNTFIPMKYVIDNQTFPFVPEDDKMLIRTLQVFQKKLDIPFDTHISIEVKRNIIEKPNNILDDEHWRTFDANKVGLINVSCKNIHNIEYGYRDKTDSCTNEKTLITLNDGQMIGYDENNFIEHKMTSIKFIKNSTLGVYDQLIFMV